MKLGVISLGCDKATVDSERLVENMAAVVDTINRLRPTAIKGQFVKTAHLTTTMGPSVPLDLAATLTLKVE